MRRKCVLTTVFFLISFVAVSTVDAGLLKKGSGRYRSVRSSQLNILNLGDDRMQINYDETGVVADAPPDSPFFNASFRTMGTSIGEAIWALP